MEKYRRAGMLVLVALLAVVLAMLAEKRNGFETSGTPIENRLRTVLSEIRGVGEVDVLVNESAAGEIIGVCVVTDAADDVAAVFGIQRTVSTVLGVENERIEVIGKGEDGR